MFFRIHSKIPLVSLSYPNYISESICKQKNVVKCPFFVVKLMFSPNNSENPCRSAGIFGIYIQLFIHNDHTSKHTVSGRKAASAAKFFRRRKNAVNTNALEIVGHLIKVQLFTAGVFAGDD